MDQDDVILKTDSRVNQGTTVIFDFFLVTTRDDFQVLDISGPIPSLLVQLTFHHCKWVRSRDLSRHR